MMNFKNVITSLSLALITSSSAFAVEQVYNVGSTPTGRPFTYVDVKTQATVGIMIDLVNAVGKEAGFTTKVDTMPFSALADSLKTKRIDIIAAAFGMTAEREKVLAFTVPFFEYGEGLVVPNSDTKNYKTFADMKGMVIGIQLGTTYIQPAEASGAFKEVKLYDATGEMLKDLQNRKVDAILIDFPIAKLVLKEPQFKNMRLVDSYKPSRVNKFGLAVRKDDAELLSRLNKAIKQLEESQQIRAILTKWDLSELLERK